MFSTLIEKYIQERQASKNQSPDIPGWLDSAALRAKQISIATHIVKYTHSDARGTSIYYKKKTTSGRRDPYVTTDSLEGSFEDVVGNAAAHDIAGLLQIEFNGVVLLSLIDQGDSKPFESFADSKERLNLWMSGFKAALMSKQLNSDTLAKQVYFPVGGSDYHLLSPLFPSSLYQEIHNRITVAIYGEEAKTARECRKQGIYSSHRICNYPKLAIQSFGGSKPQNISKLNNSRGGKAYLLRSAPPVWKKIAKPPKKQNEFWGLLAYQSKDLITEIQPFLFRFQEAENNKNSRDRRQSYFDCLIDLLVCTAAKVQEFSPGWSYESDIPHHEKVWLDPQRDDLVEWQSDDDWKIEVSKQFSRWTASKLKPKSNEYVWGDAEINYLKNECLNYLKLGVL